MNSSIGFRVLETSRSGRARLGLLETAHGVVHTPAFVPVGTQATVKGLSSADLDEIGVECALANTYHLYLRPGPEVIERSGGLHGFMNYSKPIFTDSGGFQVLSLGVGLEEGVGKVIDLFADDSKETAALTKKVEIAKEKGELLDRRSFCKVDDEGVTFMSHLDGTLHRWTAERSMEIQAQLGADVIFAMDECTSPTHDYVYTKASMYRSHDWEERSLNRFTTLQSERRVKGLHGQQLYGIVQGGPHEDLRRESAKWVNSQEFDGIGIGGALVSKRTMVDILSWVLPELDDIRPRHLLGIGGIDDILLGVEWGIDTFDCAHPTRIARRGHLLLSPENGGSRKNGWRMAIGKKEYADDLGSIDPGFDCPLLRGYSRAYLRHLFWARELTYYRLATLHNVHFMMKFMEEVRVAVGEGRLEEVKKRWLG